MAVPELTPTSRGYEMRFVINHLGHFVLSVGLHDALAASDEARIVAVSSSGHQRSPVVFDDPHYRFRSYDPFGAYGQPKTANLLFAVEANRRWAPEGITANAAHPGGIATALQHHVGGSEYMRRAAHRFREAGDSLKTPEQGAATSVLLGAAPQLAGIGGRYFEDCNQAPTIHHRGETGLGGCLLRDRRGQRRPALGPIARVDRLTNQTHQRFPSRSDCPKFPLLDLTSSAPLSSTDRTPPGDRNQKRRT